MERIVDVREYLKAFVNARNNPSQFQVLHDCTIIKDWNAELSKLFLNKPIGTNKEAFKIQSYVRLHFDGDVIITYSSYDQCNSLLFNFLKSDVNLNLELVSAPSPGIADAKKKDVKDLMKYLSPDEIEVFMEFCNLD